MTHVCMQKWLCHYETSFFMVLLLNFANSFPETYSCSHIRSFVLERRICVIIMIITAVVICASDLVPVAGRGSSLGIIKYLHCHLRNEFGRRWMEGGTQGRGDTRPPLSTHLHNAKSMDDDAPKQGTYSIPLTDKKIKSAGFAQSFSLPTFHHFSWLFGRKKIHPLCSLTQNRSMCAQPCLLQCM